MLFRRHFLWSALASITLVDLGGAQSSTTELTRVATTATAKSTTPSSSKSTSTGEATHTISVGPKSSPHAYVPHTIKANPGDTVVFEFYPTNHSVVKADYGAPCVPADEGVFYSGAFEDFDSNGPAPTWSVVINDTRPTFFYCTAIGSCIDNGMVGVINPNSSQTFQSQYSKALSYPYMLVPGQEMPAEGSNGSGSGSDSGSDSGSSGGGGLSKGAIAGIAVAGVVFVGILVALFFLLGRNRVYKKWMSSEDGRNERTARWAMFNNTNGGGTDVASNPGKPPMTDTTSVTGPDYNRYSAMSPQLGETAPSQVSSSPQPSGHWSWDPSLNARVHGPSELDATHSIHQLPESSNER